MLLANLIQPIRTKIRENNKNSVAFTSNNQSFTQKENIPGQRKKKHFWKPYGFKYCIIDKGMQLDRYLTRKLNLYTFPKKYSIRKWSTKGNKWRKFILKKLYMLKLNVKRIFQPWRDSTWRKDKNRLYKELKVLYTKYEYLIGKKTKDYQHFFKTLNGQFLIYACVQYHKKIMERFRFRKIAQVKNFKTNRSKWRKLMRLYRTALTTTHLMYYKKKPISHKFISNARAIFSLYYYEYRRNPWKNAIMFKQYLYWGTQNKFSKSKIYTKPYLRIKKPYKEKRNKIFKWLEYQLGSKQSKRYGKAMRTKQIVAKIIFSFYGHIRPRQFTHIIKKTKRIKSKQMIKTDMLLSHLELRLDVLVYRLNLAPSIFWSQQLIEAGKIFILKNTQQNNWCEMYKNTWAIAFPLRLRDPKNIYSKRNWLNKLSINRFKFFLAPTTNPNHLVQIGDVLFTSPENKINKLLMTKELFKKPLPTHLMAHQELRLGWHTSLKNPRLTPTAMWQKDGRHPLSATVLFYPRSTDLTKSDRIKSTYINKLLI